MKPVLDRYDRTDVTPGIVHCGVGGFHRAYQAVYLDELFAAGRFSGASAYPEAQAEEDAFQARVRDYHEHLAQEEDLTEVKDTTGLTRLLRIASVIALAIIFVFGWRVFNSPDLYTYYVNLEHFYTVALWGSLIYFALAAIGQQLTNRVVRALAAEAGRTGPPVDESSVTARRAQGVARKARGQPPTE